MSISKGSVSDFVRRQNEMLGEEIAAAAKELKETSFRPSIPEQIFVQNFLPFFNGEKVSSASIVADWMKVAGTPVMEVDVIGANGEVVAVIPPLIDTSCIRTSKVLDDDSYRNMIVRLKEAPDIVKQKALIRANNEIERKSVLKDMASGDKWDKALSRWNKNGSANSNSGKNSFVSTADDSDDLDF